MVVGRWMGSIIIVYLCLLCVVLCNVEFFIASDVFVNCVG